MNAEKEDIPFSYAITKLCELTDSQEEKLLNCPFAREPETSSDHPSPSQPSPIVVVSVPSSADSQLPREDAEYYTPPEHHSHSHLSSSEDPNPNARVLEVASGDEPGSKRAKVVTGDEFDGDAVALGEDENEITVLGSGGFNGGEKPQTKRGKNGGSLKAGGLMKDGGEKLKHSAKRIQALSETEGDENEITVLGSGGFNGGEKPQTKRGKNVESSGSLMKDGGEKLKHSGKRIENFRYSEEGREVRRVRQLPPSFKGKGKEKEKDSVEKKSGQGLLDLLGILEGVFTDADDGSEDVDIIETAKRKGMVFPRPRWWPPPGVDDEHYR